VDAPKSDITVVVTRSGATARTIAVRDRLFVGRACHGIDPDHRLLLDDAGVSRDHCQIQVDPGRRAFLVDTSTNGTRVNGTLVQRSVAVPLSDGDVVSIGAWSLVVRQAALNGSVRLAPGPTIRRIVEGAACIVCGDLIDYTTLTEAYGGQAVFEAMLTIFDRLRTLLLEHQGTLYDYVGDAFLAIWEEAATPDAARSGARFAVAAAAEVEAVAASLAIRRLDGSPLRMGWAVTHGPVAMSAYAGPLAGLLGDAVNVGFRLAGMAGRDGRSPVLVSADAVRAGATVEGVGPEERLTVKGHREPVAVHQVALPARSR
jgi:class 3 adenylate cyclase